MRTYEVGFKSVNFHAWAGKPTTMLVVEPDAVDAGTGAILCTHGWGGNRFQHREVMEHAAAKFNLVALAVEYRQSGFDFDPVTGTGACWPYDASFYQVLDVLNGLRETLALRPGLDRRRVYHFGGSQGGHIALLSALFAPDTFAAVYAGSPVTRITPDIATWAGREFSGRELSDRDVVEHAADFQCPVFLEHGTADAIVPHHEHTEPLERELKRLGKVHDVKYHEGGGHGLEPVTTRAESFKERAAELFRLVRPRAANDFSEGSCVRLKCLDKTLVIDWSQAASSAQLVRFE